MSYGPDPSTSPTLRHPTAVDGGVTPIAPRPPRAPRPGEGEAASPAGRPAARRQEAAATRRPVPLVLVLLLALLGAAGMSVMGQKAGAGAFEGSREFARLGGPWLIAGFVGGAIGGWRRGASGLLLGAFVGAVVIGAGSVAYYGLSYWEGGNDARRAAKLGIGWGVAGIGIGGVLGLLGAAYTTALGRHRQRRSGRVVAAWLHGAALGTLGGLLVGEAIALLWVWESLGLRTMAVLEGIGGLALVAGGIVGRSWRFAFAAVVFAAVSATIAPIATTLVRETLRTIGWAGA